ncbi:hypothetical protein [Paeniglutamicibacter gangotriensis]|uniref:Uncharacterized protein n=1 Tax=Paeniglutamicibacter gangotriensis Lz1y TaxID=1276920 RepID=M7MRT6_9MICC|nr:hypothetical protein [Paeniglutamicibacter gangotriensis]EMQ99122.1 hypothetical protein ADIAG_01112 [Paeniglutamicibacter gangotriensis Lz1y]
MPQRKIAIEFSDENVTDARALARAMQFVFEASRVGDGTVYVEGFAMNPKDGWQHGDHRIDIVKNP